MELVSSAAVYPRICSREVRSSNGSVWQCRIDDPNLTTCSNQCNVFSYKMVVIREDLSGSQPVAIYLATNNRGHVGSFSSREFYHFKPHVKAKNRHYVIS